MDAEFAERNRETRARLQRLVEQLSDDDMRRELPGGWTIADTLGHLAFYDRRAAILLTRFAREGVTASPYDDETINQALLHLTRQIPPRAVATEALAAAEAADEAAAATPPALIADIHQRDEVRLERSVHRQHHLDDIEAALSSS